MVRMFLQETFVLYDSQYYDMGTQSEHTDVWYMQGLTLTRYSDYSELSETTSGTTGSAYTLTDYRIAPTKTVEFDFMQIDGSISYAPIYIRNSANGNSLGALSLYNINKPINTWVHLRIVFDNDNSKFYVYVDDNPTPVERTLSNTDSLYRIYFYTPTDISALRFKNFIVY